MRKLAVMLGLLALLVPATVFAGSVGSGGDGDDGDDFLLGGTAQNAQDPENPANDVIRISTLTPPFFGTVSRALNTRIQRLDNMLEFKAYFVAPKSCFGGSPRMQLAIDLNGDRRSDGNAFGYYGPPPAFTACPPNTWRFEDLTDELPRWDLTQFACNPAQPQRPCFATPAFVVPWSVAEQLVGAFANHTVCSGALVDDTFLATSSPNVMSGIAYYDVISIGRATWEDHDDTAGRGFARGCGRDDDDEGDEGDNDRDGDRDAADADFSDNRRKSWGN